MAISTKKPTKKIPAIIVNAPSLVVKKPVVNTAPTDVYSTIRNLKNPTDNFDKIRELKSGTADADIVKSAKDAQEPTPVAPKKNNLLPLLVIGGGLLYLFTRKKTNRKK